MPSRFIGILSVCLAALGIGAAGSAAAAAPTPLVVCYADTNALHWDLDVAFDEGFFRKEAFAPEHVSFQSPSQAIQLVLTGSGQIGATQTETMITAVLHGATDLGAILQQTSRPDWMLIATPDIKNWSDLKGARIGLGTLVGSEYYLTAKLIAAHGVSKSNWVPILIGPTGAKLAALKNHSTAAGVLFQPLAVAASEEGLHELGDYASIGDYASTVLAISRHWAAQNDNGVRLGRALRGAQEWLAAPENRATAIAILRKHSKVDEAAADRAYDFYFGKGGPYIPDGAVQVSGVRAALALMQQIGAVTPDQARDVDPFILPASLGGLSR